jgi:hypothetical protein
MLIILLLLSAALAQAQVSMSTLFGEVRDASSSLAPGVRITARQVATGFVRHGNTGALGAYRFDDLAPGLYTVTAEKPGFRQAVARSVLLEISHKARLDFVLEVGPEVESVTVSATISPLQTEEASSGYRLDSREILALPLAERNLISLVTLGPGAIPRHLGGFVHDVVNDVQEGSRGAVALNPPINGARSTMNAYLLDGAYNTDRNTFAIAVAPPMESVQEFRIQSSLPSAEFAQSAGGVVDIVTKSGGHDWHGSAFELFRNESMDAKNFFDDPALQRPIFRGNQFGASLSGPALPRSTFFSAIYEGRRGKDGKSSVNVVPDAAMRSGDFRSRAPIYDPLNASPATGLRQPFPANVIPANRVDPIVRQFIDRYEPLPNRAGAGGNYLDSTPSLRTGDTLSGRLDHQFRSGSRLFGRYTVNSDRDRLASSFPVLPSSERLRAQQAAISHFASGTSWMNEMRVSFTRLRQFDVPESAFHTNVAAELGMSGAPADPFTYGLPYFLVTNVSTVTDSPSLPQVQRNNNWRASDGVSLARGRRTWKFGIEVGRCQVNYLQSRFVRGQYTFSGAFTASPETAQSGDAFADFLLGFPQLTTRNVGTTQSYLRQTSWAGYVQQDWRATARLSLSFGLRYEYASPFTEARSNLLNLDYSRLPAAPSLVRVASASNSDRDNFAPRFGFALRLPESRAFGSGAVFRAGYGVYFSQEIASETFDLTLNGVRNERNNTDGGRAPVLTVKDGFPSTAGTGFPSYFGLDPAVRTPYMQQWAASVQRELPARVLLDVAYIGSKGTKLGRFRRFNTPLHVITGKNLSPRPGDLQSLRPFPQLGVIFQRQHTANSTYHSLQIKTEKRFSGKLAFLASFVWSKSIDDADSVIPGFSDSAGAEDERNLRLERSLSSFNVGRRISAGFVYGLPSARRLRLLLGNWQTSGIITLQDGTPLNPVYFAFDPANTGTPNRPDVVPGQKLALPRGEQTIERFFNTAALAAPKPYTFGNAGRNILPGPGNNVFDLALHRRFPIRERQSLEFRAEAFNTFNHPNWGIPGPFPDFGPFFGRILATGQPRRLQLGLRFDF